MTTTEELTMHEARDYARRKYGSNYLRLVLCQIQFPILMRFDEPAFQGSLQEALRVEYPRVQQEQQIAVTMGLGGGLVSSPAGAQWRYQDLDGAWSVVLQRNFAGLETSRYDDYEDFEQRLSRLLQALAQHGITVCERLGLRYINEFRHADGARPSDWKILLREDLLGIASEELLDGRIEHAVQDIRTTRVDGTLVMRHGFVNGGDGRGPYYLLDLDHFREGPRDYDEEAVLREARTFHETISRVFEMTLQPAMRKHMQDEGPIDA
jgi:uncharacterized protein (TIGR04255 family)